MKSAFEIFVLTKREQRAVILIMMALLAATIANHYRDQQSEVISTESVAADPNASPSPSSEEEQTTEGRGE